MTPIIPSFEAEEEEEPETHLKGCPDCDGTGNSFWDRGSQNYDSCNRCDGTGVIMVDQDGNEVKK